MKLFSEKKTAVASLPTLVPVSIPLEPKKKKPKVKHVPEPKLPPAMFMVKNKEVQCNTRVKVYFTEVQKAEPQAFDAVMYSGARVVSTQTPASPELAPIHLLPSITPVPPKPQQPSASSAPSASLDASSAQPSRRSKPEGTFACLVVGCSSTFGRKHDLQRHVDSVHLKKTFE